MPRFGRYVRTQNLVASVEFALNRRGDLNEATYLGSLSYDRLAAIVVKRHTDLHAQDLTAYRVAGHTNQILIETLENLPARSSTLPQDLQSPIDLVTSQLTGQVLAADRDILTADTHVFLSNIDIVASALSDQFSISASLLCKVADPQQTPDVDHLCAKAEELLDAATHTLPKDLAYEKYHLANTAYAFLMLHLQLLQTVILILERTQHGTLARATTTRAENAAARASLLGLQAKVHAHAHPPPEEFLRALKKFRADQGSNQARLRDRGGLAARALDLYGRAGEKGMRDLAGRKCLLLSEIERMEKEIQGLERDR